MDPLTHTLLTGLLIDRRPGYLVLANLPDLPFYLVYPAWVARQGRVCAALKTGDWPAPPPGLQPLHHALHSLLVALGVGWVLRLLLGRWPWRLLATWGLHIAVDIPTHARRYWAPQFLWPLSKFTVAGVSWVHVLLRWLRW